MPPETTFTLSGTRRCRNKTGIIRTDKTVKTKKRIILIGLTWILFSLIGCAKPVEIMEIPPVEPERISVKNYEINRLQLAYVGDAIIKAKDYWVRHDTKSKIRCLNDFTLQHPFGSHSGARGTTYEISGTIMDEDKKRYLVKFPNMDNLNFGITETAQWANFVVDDANERRGSIMSLTPEDTTFEFVDQTRIDESRDFVNFEIIFNGTTRDAVKLLYLEYTPEDTTRPAFQRTLTYPIDTDIIRFRQIRIKIHEVTRESISYTVLEDGLNG